MARKSADSELEYEDDFELDEEDENETEAEEEATPKAKAKAAPKRKKIELPETHVTPVGFTKVLKEARGVEVRPQVIYGHVKNSKTFPSGHHVDGRVIIPIDEGLNWWDEKEARLSAKAASKSEE